MKCSKPNTAAATAVASASMYTAGAQHSSSRLSIWRPAPQERKYCFVLTSLVLGGLHQRSGVALPTGGRADPAVGNEALAGTRRSVFFSLVPGARWYPTLKPRQYFCMWYIIPHTKTKMIAHVHTCTRHTGTRGRIFFGMCQLETRFARIIGRVSTTDHWLNLIVHGAMVNIDRHY